MEKLSLSQMQVLNELLFNITHMSRSKEDLVFLRSYIMSEQEYDTIKELSKLFNILYWNKIKEYETK